MAIFAIPISPLKLELFIALVDFANTLVKLILVVLG